MRRTSPGFTLIELLMILGVIAIIFGVAVPTFVQSQREQNLKSVAQGFESALTALRNLALTGRAITDDDGKITEPSGYCMRTKRSPTALYFLEPFSYEENGTVDDFTPEPIAGNDTKIHVLKPAPIAVPDMVDRFPRVDLLGAWRIDADATVDVYDPAPTSLDVTPIVCFTPPKGEVRIIQPDGTLITTAALAYEFGITGAPTRLRVQVDSITGRITATNALEPPLTASP